MEQKIGFIGAGQMARALAVGFVAAKLVEGSDIWASDPVEAARNDFASLAAGAHTSAENRGVAENANIVFLAVKPQQLAAVLANLKPHLSAKHLLVSIVAGAPLAKISSALEPGVRLVRVMPNTPCLVGQSASGYALGSGATADDGRTVASLLGAVGIAYELEEKHLDAVTGLAGSGPAFVYTMIEALSDGGVLMGLPRTVATALAAQTVRGAAAMVLETGEHPGTLKDRVASPGGTTIAGLKSLEAGGIRHALMEAVRAATLRSIELGKS